MISAPGGPIAPAPGPRCIWWTSAGLFAILMWVREVTSRPGEPSKPCLPSRHKGGPDYGDQSVPGGAFTRNAGERALSREKAAGVWGVWKRLPGGGRTGLSGESVCPERKPEFDHLGAAPVYPRSEVVDGTGTFQPAARGGTVR